jgi:hypothetical protein
MESGDGVSSCGRNDDDALRGGVAMADNDVGGTGSGGGCGPVTTVDDAGVGGGSPYWTASLCNNVCKLWCGGGGGSFRTIFFCVVDHTTD